MEAKKINDVLAANLQYFMRERGFDSQKELAKKASVSQRTVSNYLNPAQRQPSKSGKEPSAKLTELERLGAALGVGVWDLLRDISPSEREFYAQVEDAYRRLIDRKPEPDS